MKLAPKLCRPDWDLWERCFPDGVGPSAFSSPVWQRLMQQEMGPEWKNMFLRARTKEGRILSLPVLVKPDRWGRKEIVTRPAAYSVMPIERYDAKCGPAVSAMIDAVRTPLTAGFAWWLPPWCIWRERCGANDDLSTCPPSDPSEVSRWCYRHVQCFSDQGWFGGLNVSTWDTYVINVDESCDDYLAHRVKKQQRQHLRSSYQAGVEVISHPTSAMVDGYYRLYLRVWDERGWTGPKYSSAFFHDIAAKAGRGGELALVRYEGRIVGGGVILYDRYASHLFQATTERDIKPVYPHAVLYMRAIEAAKGRGLRYVNLGGVNEGNEGLKRFKREWGATATPIFSIFWQCRRWSQLKNSF